MIKDKEELGKIQKGWLKSHYRAKDCSLSATDICRPDAQLWAKAQYTEEDFPSDLEVGFKSYLGTALHALLETEEEPGAIKEFSYIRKVDDKYSLGGTLDELRYIPERNVWRIGDIKLKAAYSCKKFLGIGTKANPNPAPERDKEIMQMSIYRWLLQDLFNIEGEASIYLFAQGHMSYDKFPEVSEVPIPLLSLSKTEEIIKAKFNILQLKEQPKKDCPDWLCNYCDFKGKCKYQGEGFEDESK